MDKMVFRLPALLLSVSLAALVGCGGNSGQENASNIDESLGDRPDQGVVYTGPDPLTDDIRSFKLNVWDNLADSDRCGGCHNDTTGQEPMFVRSDNINLAYEAALTITDKVAPVLSRMVSKVDEGHSCWRDEAGVCADIITNFIQAWATETGSTENVVVLEAPAVRVPGASLQFPPEATQFGDTIWPLLRGESGCADCHAEDGTRAQQQPYFASSNLEAAYQAAKTKIDLNSASASRFVERMRERHNCWVDDSGQVADPCTYSAAEMQRVINDYLGLIPEAEEIDESLVISNAVNLTLDGIVVSSGGRVDSDVIAMYQFKQGEGGVAADTSGVEPPLDLLLSPQVEWVGSWGIRFPTPTGIAPVYGKAIGDTVSSRKLYDLIRATGEYSIETWVVPANVTQEGPARILTYSGDQDNRNFTLGQTLYDYNYMSLSRTGSPTVSTPSAQEVLQATLQHVVVTFDPIEGRRLYVNGELRAQDDEAGGSLADWDPGYPLVLGNETDNMRPWLGTVRMLAIFNRALSENDVVSNFDAGVGQKFFLLFGVSDVVDMPEAYIVFEVEVFDEYSYQFSSPFFISLDKDAVPASDIRIQGIRIGVNGREINVGQSFSNVDVTINAANYDANVGVPVWQNAEGTVIPMENGADDDLFFLTFDNIGGNTYDRPADDVPALPEPQDLEAQSDIGLRTFDEINATLSALTGVNATAVAGTYSQVIQQLPSSENATSFLAAHQSGVMQLSLAYCTALSGDDALRSAYFPDFDFGSNADLTDEQWTAQVITPLLDRLLVNSSLSTQPDSTEMRDDLIQLIGEMTAATNTTIVTAVCTASVGGAVMLLQ